jgi:NADH-quinone oxidoreductase subunit J
MMAETVFYILAACTVVAGLGCISARNPIASVMWLVAAMFGLAGIYLLHGAEFIAAIQVLVYAGAIMVLFLFVIMLLNIGAGPADLRTPPMRMVAVGVGAVLLVELAALARYSAARIAVEAAPVGGRALGAPTDLFPGAAQALAGTAERGVVGGIAEPLFTTYLVPFEITSVLLLAAAVGAVVLAKRKI